MADGLGPDDTHRLRLLLPRPIRRLPADLAVVVALVGLTNLAALVPVVRETPLRIVVGLPFVLFVPGYAFIAALFPERGEPPGSDATGEDDDPDAGADRRRGIDGIERVALAFGLSIAIVPLLGLVLNFTPWGIRLVPILLAVSGFTIIATAFAAIRRWALPEDERFRVPYRSWYAAGRSELLEPESRTDAALNVLLVLSIVLAVTSVGYAVAVPKQGETFSELYLLTRGEDGELVAADYPTELVQGQPAPLVVGIGNQEHERTEYAIVVELQRVRLANNSTTVVEERELRRFSATLSHNETWIRDHNVTPTLTGERLRLLYLLYRGNPPVEPSVESAYLENHLWVNVSAP